MSVPYAFNENSVLSHGSVFVQKLIEVHAINRHFALHLEKLTRFSHICLSDGYRIDSIFSIYIFNATKDHIDLVSTLA